MNRALKQDGASTLALCNYGVKVFVSNCSVGGRRLCELEELVEEEGCEWEWEIVIGHIFDGAVVGVGGLGNNWVRKQS